jgi:DNA-binding transcriptional regulator YiaG
VRLGVANRRKSIQELIEIDGIGERLREFLRLNYITGAEVARRIGVRDMTVYSWLQGESRPSKPERITEFLNSIPAEPGSWRSTKRLPVSGVQKLARYPETASLSVL